jgi:hypothetical protein
MDALLPLVGTIVGGLIAVAGGYFAARFQAREQQRTRELQRGQERHDRLESIYVAMLGVATQSHRYIDNEELERLKKERISSTFRLLASREVLDAFGQCSDLWYEWEPGDEYDAGSAEMKQAFDALVEAMRAHLAEVGGGPRRAELIAPVRPSFPVIERPGLKPTNE